MNDFEKLILDDLQSELKRMSDLMECLKKMVNTEITKSETKINTQTDATFVKVNTPTPDRVPDLDRRLLKY